MLDNTHITFQLTAHYLPKIALHLECLLLTLEQASKEEHPVIHHSALKNTIEIIRLIEKPELKSRFLKELVRFEHAVNKSGEPLSHAQYDGLFSQVQLLNHASGRFSDLINKDPFLQSIRSSQATHSQDCGLHAPQLSLWLSTEPTQRQQDLNLWFTQLQPVHDTVMVYLSLLRDTAVFEPISLVRGFYQRAFSTRVTNLIILLKMDKQAGLVPKIQLGQNGFSLMLCDARSMREVHQNTSSIELGICQL